MTLAKLREREQVNRGPSITNRFKGALVVMSLYDAMFSKASRERTWNNFMHHGTNHSARAGTLAHIINRCEREGVAYLLNAYPGQGYYIRQNNNDAAMKAVADETTQDALRLDRIRQIIEAVDRRAMANDGPVTPTLEEMNQREISMIYALACRKPEDWKPRAS